MADWSYFCKNNDNMYFQSVFSSQEIKVQEQGYWKRHLDDTDFRKRHRSPIT